MEAKAHMDDETKEALRGRGTEAMRTINDKIRSVLEEAPSDSAAELTVRRAPGGYKGFLRIHSQQRKFVGGGQAQRFSEVVEQMFREVRGQIKEWKRARVLTTAD